MQNTKHLSKLVQNARGKVLHDKYFTFVNKTHICQQKLCCAKLNFSNHFNNKFPL